MANRSASLVRYNKLTRMINDQRRYIATHNYEYYPDPNGIRRADLAYLARLVAARLSGKPIWYNPKPGMTGESR